jgi:DNA-binding GntR family transcriptional regulator
LNTRSKIDEVVQIITDKINQGIYYAGYRLPSERHMSKELNISRSTVRAALLRLQAENLVEIVPRGGAFVRSAVPLELLGDTNLPKIEEKELQTSDTHMQVLQQQGREVLVRFLDRSKIIPAGDQIAKKLNVTRETEVFRRYRVQIVDRIPYRIMEGYYLASLLRELCERDQELYPLQRWDDNYVPFFTWLREEKNFYPTTVKERLKCRMPTAEEASILNIARNQPVIEMHRWVWGKFKCEGKDTLYEYSRFICNASLHEFEYGYDVNIS